MHHYLHWMLFCTMIPILWAQQSEYTSGPFVFYSGLTPATLLPSPSTNYSLTFITTSINGDQYLNDTILEIKFIFYHIHLGPLLHFQDIRYFFPAPHGKAPCEYFFTPKSPFNTTDILCNFTSFPNLTAKPLVKFIIDFQVDEEWNSTQGPQLNISINYSHSFLLNGTGINSPGGISLGYLLGHSPGGGDDDGDVIISSQVDDGSPADGTVDDGATADDGSDGTDTPGDGHRPPEEKSDGDNQKELLWILIGTIVPAVIFLFLLLLVSGLIFLAWRARRLRKARGVPLGSIQI